MSRSPIVLIPCNRVSYQDTFAYIVKQQYMHPLLEIVKCTPLLIPAIGKDFDFRSVMESVDGILLTGAPSHVSPSHYNAEQEFEDEYLDNLRDDITLPLLRAAIAKDIPVFAICRGFQELNVACGGTLHQYVHKLPGKLDHRQKTDIPLGECYLHQAHQVRLESGGLFEKWGLPAAFSVNSVHTQGINKLGTGLRVEAVAEDGLTEAISMPGKKFIMGTQWHPEGDYTVNAPNARLFEEFGKAIR